MDIKDTLEAYETAELERIEAQMQEQALKDELIRQVLENGWHHCLTLSLSKLRRTLR